MSMKVASTNHNCSTLPPRTLHSLHLTLRSRGTQREKQLNSKKVKEFSRVASAMNQNKQSFLQLFKAIGRCRARWETSRRHAPKKAVLKTFLKKKMSAYEHVKWTSWGSSKTAKCFTSYSMLAELPGKWSKWAFGRRSSCSWFIFANSLSTRTIGSTSRKVVLMGSHWPKSSGRCWLRISGRSTETSTSWATS